MSTFKKVLCLNLFFFCSIALGQTLKGEMVSLRATTPASTCSGGKIIYSTSDSQVKVCQGGTYKALGLFTTGSITDGQLLIGHTSNNAFSKATLTAGSNITITNGAGTITIAASSAASVNPFNYLVNPQFRFAQRQVPGTLTTLTDGGYGPDQWYMLDSNGGSASQYARAAGESAGSQYTDYIGQFRQVNAVAKQIMVCQPLENKRTMQLRGLDVAFAFYARTDGTEITTLRACIGEWTSTADTITKDVVSSWAATPTWISNFACKNTPSDITISSSWSQSTTTVTLGTSVNNLILCVWTPNAEAQNDDFYLSQAQLVNGTSALNWYQVQNPYAFDLMESQRFYEKSSDLDTLPSAAALVNAFTWAAGSNSNGKGTVPFKVTKFKAPSISFWDIAGNASRTSWWTSGNVKTDNSNSASIAVPVTNSVGFGGFMVNDAVNTALVFGIQWAADSSL